MYTARRYRDEAETVYFSGFSDGDLGGDGSEVFRGGRIPYEDAQFRAAAWAALQIEGVRELRVLISTDGEPYQPVDLDRLAVD